MNHLVVLIWTLLTMSLALIETETITPNIHQPWTISTDMETVYSSAWFNNDKPIYHYIEADTHIPQFIEKRLNFQVCNQKQEAACGGRVCRVHQLVDQLKINRIRKQENYGPYYCECKDNEVLHEEIDHDFLADIKVSCTTLLCDRCNWENTKKCTSIEGRTVCYCHPGYDPAKFCETKFEACDFEVAKGISASTACGTTVGNTCKLFSLNSEYICYCKNQYREKKQLPYANCMEFASCEQDLCVHFRPPPATTIPGRKHVIRRPVKCEPDSCVCPTGWYGKFCSLQLSVPRPGSWTPWSACNPDCVYPYEEVEHPERLEYATGNARSSGLGHRLKLASCDTADVSTCQDEVGKWERCKVTSVCSGWLKGQISNRVRTAMQQRLDEHNEKTDLETPLNAQTASLSAFETKLYYATIIFVALTYTTLAIAAMELHYLILIWNQSLSREQIVRLAQKLEVEERRAKAKEAKEAKEAEEKAAIK